MGVIKGVGEVTTVTAGVISDTVRAAIKGTKGVGVEATDAISGLVRVLSLRLRTRQFP